MPLALTGYEWGLLSAAAAFIVFALVVALVVPRSRPAFPSVHLGWFIAACIVFFAVQMTAVVLLAEVGEAHEAAGTEPSETEPPPTETTPTDTTDTETTDTETTETTDTETTETETTETETTQTTTTETTTTAPAEGDAAAGREVFLGPSACGSCHTLADAGASGTVGPNLDQSQPDAALVVERVTNGSGVMPSFSDSLTEQEIQDVAAYVSSVAGG